MAAPRRVMGPREPGRLSAAVVRRMRAVCVVVLDVDGVMTDGRLPYLVDHEDMKGSREFDVKDGLAIAHAIRAGVPCAVITSKAGEAVRRRCLDLGVEELVTGREDKRSALDELTGRMGIAPRDVAFMGDDLLDLSAMEQAGLAIAPADAAPEVLRAAHYVTARRGGEGCVREAVRAILIAKHLWPGIVQHCRGL